MAIDRKKLVRLLELKGNSPLALLKFAEQLETKVFSEMERLLPQLVKEVSKKEVESLVFSKLEMVKGVKGDRGEQGIRGLIGMRGPKGETGSQGPKGDQGIQGLKGERGEKGEQGLRGFDGKDGLDGKDGKDGKDGSIDTGKEIILKINELDLNDPRQKIDAAHIKNLPSLAASEIKRITRQVKGGGGDTVRVEDLTSQTDGTTKVFTITRNQRVLMLVCPDFPIIYRPTIDFTVSGTTLTLTDAVGAPSLGQTLLLLYVEGA